MEVSCQPERKEALDIVSLLIVRGQLICWSFVELALETFSYYGKQTLPLYQLGGQSPVPTEFARISSMEMKLVKKYKTYLKFCTILFLID